ncbi:hypothetical protein ACR8AL_14520, partial [Clavibacter sepedonicus]
PTHASRTLVSRALATYAVGMGHIPVAVPRFWWRADAATVQFWASSNPDIDDNKIRHADADEHNWQAIADAVVAVGNALASRSWTFDADSPLYADLDLPDYPGELSQIEQDIVRSWFNYWEAVRFDPWDLQPENGRHRLWRTLPHFGTALIPICGSALGYATPENVAALGPSWPQDFARQLYLLRTSSAFDGTDAVNVQFEASMVDASQGRLPPLM